MPAKIMDDDWIKLPKYNLNSNGCWIWNGPKTHDGYGKCGRRKNQTLAHRAFYAIIRGDLIDGYEIDHLCHNRLCVNPDHMEQVPHAVNVMRAIRIRENHRNARKTHCKRGHEFTEENTVIEEYSGNRVRKCRICKNQRQRDRWRNKVGRPKG